MDRELFKKYIRNNCTEEELNSVLDWFKFSSGTKEGKDFLLGFWNDIKLDEADDKINYDSILDGIHHRINISRSNKLASTARKNISNKRILFFSQAAAILVLLFSIYISIKYYSIKHSQTAVAQAYNEVTSSLDAITKVTLPDGSNVWLNHSSILKYPATFIGDSRTVELKGEGYFEVITDPTMPFVVKTGEINIIAHGTSFNVLAYPDEEIIETSLIEGKLDLERIHAGEKPGSIYKMSPSDFVRFDKSKKEFIPGKIADDRYFSWRKGKLVFRNDSMDKAILKLSRWFNVDIVVIDSEVFDITFTATFEQENLVQVMDLLTMITPVKYTITSRKEFDDGTYTKRRVILSYSNN